MDQEVWVDFNGDDPRGPALGELHDEGRNVWGVLVEKHSVGISHEGEFLFRGRVILADPEQEKGD